MTQYYFLSVSAPLYTHASGFLLKAQFALGQMMKQSHRCFSVTLVSVGCVTPHDKQVQPGPPSYQPSLVALPMALQAFQPLQ